VKVLAKLSRGVVEIVVGDEYRYANPSFLQRAYLLWTFRNFRRLSVRILNPRQRQILERLSNTARTAKGRRIDPALVIGRAEFPTLLARKPPSPLLAWSTDQAVATQHAVSGTRRRRRVDHLAQLPRVIARHAAETFASSAIRRTQSRASYSLILTLASASLVMISGAVAQRLWINHGKSPLLAKANTVSQQPIATDAARPTTAARPLAAATTSSASEDAKRIADKPVTTAALQVSGKMTSAAPASKVEAVTHPPKPIQTNSASFTANAGPESTRLRVFLAPRSVIYPAIPTSGDPGGNKKHILVKAIVNADGTVDDVQIPGEGSSLARAISMTVKQWRYRPYLLNGQPVEVETHMIFTVLGPDAITVRFLSPGEVAEN
jgi:periplasmic protein TonB